MSNRTSLKGKVAAITGAGSGIGRYLAINLADEGCPVVISDVDEKGLQETANMLDDKPVDVTTHLIFPGENLPQHMAVADVAQAIVTGAIVTSGLGG